MSALDERNRAGTSSYEHVLAPVLASSSFRRSARLRAFLEFVVTETEAGRGDDLREHSIAVGALDCPESFDQRFDPRVRVMAGRVRKALDRYYEGEGARDPVRITMPRGAYRTLLVPAEVGRPIIEDERAGHADPDRGPAVAVVTLLDLSAEQTAWHLAAGLSESLVATMSAYPGCTVIGPVDAATGSGVDGARALGTMLGATHVLQGSVRSLDTALRVSVRLSDAASGEIVWSEVFDDDVDGLDLFSVEDRIVRRVSGVVADFRGVIHQHRGHPAGGHDAGGHEAGTYDAKLRYYAYLGTLDTTMAGPTTDALEDALERSPDDPQLMAMLAGMVLFRGVGQLGDASPGDVAGPSVQRAIELARRSNAIDPANPHALTVLAIIELLQGRPDRCRHELERVIQMRPTNPSLLFMAGVGLALSGDWSRGIAQIEEAFELNTLHPGWQNGFLALDALTRGDAAHALAEAQLVDTPGLIWGPLLRAAALAALGRLDDAAAELALLPVDLPGAASSQRAVFEGHMRLPDDVVAALVGALAQIPPPTSAA